MSAFANLVLTDATSPTPVNHTFGPVRIDENGVAWWADRSGGVALGYPIASLSVREPVGSPSAASRVYKETVKLEFPVLEQTSPSTATGIQPAPTKAYTLVASLELLLPERSTLQNRKDLAAMMRDFISEAIVTTAIENFEPIY